MALQRSFVLLGSGLLLLGSGGSAAALGIDPNPFGVVHGGVSGSVELVDVVVGLPPGGSVGLGSVSPAGTSLVFQVRIDPSSDPIGGLWLRLSDGLTPLAAEATGWIPGPDGDIVIFGSGGGWDGFVPDSGAAGTVIDRVFLSYPTALAADGSLRVEASLLSAPSAGGSALLVPEPTAALLLGAGLWTLAAARWLRRWGSL